LLDGLFRATLLLLLDGNPPSALLDGEALDLPVKEAHYKDIVVQYLQT
jgi:hypothetical protein